MVGIDLSHVGISNSKLRRQLASSLAVASAIISDSIIDWDKIVCFLDFQATTPSVILKIKPLVAFESSEREFQPALL
ncbi:ATP-dependent DNA helicase PIF1-like [Cucumis melo var. makuwa]|uniref:ATP-dependent DNA helicase PIF1-like n=1 Tax=Cucumis melo var. makuwa TaxID=1194695 RepID=A0A5D3CPF4_CUCMM|nr:ATP-dependent DNA helicase PIF1-like [Cucumis melo var. makuwa]TYK13455.1 ATP-dependent DNA helicase PIF1-like [Cucumis melo var. makuwa]